MGSMAKLAMIKPSMPMLKPLVDTLQTTRNPDAEKRIRGRRWMAIRLKWFKEHPVCAECQRNGVLSIASQLDHVVPLIDGGKDDESNYQSLCYSCHTLKTAEEAKGRGGFKV